MSLKLFHKPFHKPYESSYDQIKFKIFAIIIMITNIPLIKILLIAYLIFASSLLKPVLSKQLTDVVQNNRLIQHLLVFLSILVLITLLDEEMDLIMVIFYSVIIYLWFIFSTKMDIHFNIIIIVMLLVAYFYERSLLAKNNEVINDKVLTDDQKNKLILDLNTTNRYLTVGIMSLVVGGMLLYCNKKEVQYGGGYNVFKFLLY